MLDFIFRKTYGYNKKQDCISLNQFSLGTGLKKYAVCKAIRKLKSINIIAQKDKKYSPKSYIQKTVTKDNITKDNIATNVAEPVFSSKDIIPNLLEDKQKHIKIIGVYAQAKKVVFENKEQQTSFIRRNLRSAQNLVGYTSKQIIDTMKYLLDNADFKWTLESVGKYIDENLVEIKNINQSQDDFLDKLKQIEEEKIKYAEDYLKNVLI